MMAEWVLVLVKVSYLLAALLLIIGLQRMSSPVTASSGITWAGVGILIANAAT